MKKGKLIVISGPSGVGKGTICKELVKLRDIEVSVSMTTRAPRAGDINGVTYHFVTHEQFRYEIENGGMFEYAQIYENYYGTPKARILEKLEQGIDILLEIEMQGALQVKNLYPEAVLIFILPPSLKVLRERLEGRGTESREKIEMRLSNTLKEIEYVRHYDYAVVNDSLYRAVSRVTEIISAEHLKTAGCAEQIIEEYKEEIKP